MDDSTLQQYIDEVWNVYDVNYTNVMQPAQLHWFLNDLMLRLGDSRRYTPPELLLIFKQADVNRDGHIDKIELLRVCKLIFQKSPYVGTYTVYGPPPPNYNYTYSTQRPKNEVSYAQGQIPCQKTPSFGECHGHGHGHGSCHQKNDQC